MQLRFAMNHPAPAALPELQHDPEWKPRSSSGDTASTPVPHMPPGQNCAPGLLLGVTARLTAGKPLPKSERQVISNTCRLPSLGFAPLQSLPTPALSHYFQGLFGGSFRLTRSLAPSSAPALVLQPGGRTEPKLDTEQSET